MIGASAAAQRLNNNITAVVDSDANLRSSRDIGATGNITRCGARRLI